MDRSKTALLYDADCGFCRVVAAALLAWDRRRCLAPIALQDPRAVALLPGLTEEQRMASFHVVGPDGRRHSGGPAFAPLFELLPGGTPLARLATRFTREAGWLYGQISDHRDKLARVIPARAHPWARRKLRERAVA